MHGWKPSGSEHIICPAFHRELISQVWSISVPCSPYLSEEFNSNHTVTVRTQWDKTGGRHSTLSPIWKPCGSQKFLLWEASPEPSGYSLKNQELSHGLIQLPKATTLDLEKKKNQSYLGQAMWSRVWATSLTFRSMEISAGPLSKLARKGQKAMSSGLVETAPGR